MFFVIRSSFICLCLLPFDSSSHLMLSMNLHISYENLRLSDWLTGWRWVCVAEWVFQLLKLICCSCSDWARANVCVSVCVVRSCALCTLCFVIFGNVTAQRKYTTKNTVSEWQMRARTQPTTTTTKKRVEIWIKIINRRRKVQLTNFGIKRWNETLPQTSFT